MILKLSGNILKADELINKMVTNGDKTIGTQNPRWPTHTVTVEICNYTLNLKI